MLYYRYTIAILSLYYCYTIAILLLYYCYTIAIPSLYHHYTIAILLLYYCYTIAILLLYYRYTIAILTISNSLAGISGGRRLAGEDAGGEQSDCGVDCGQTSHRGRHREEDRNRSRGVPTGGDESQPPLLPVGRDLARERHVSDVAETVPRAVRRKSRQVSGGLAWRYLSLFVNTFVI